ncbi:MAG: hypothetical protein GXP27_14895 [Planctomycetes bacterium]|nr:hypothetical protein [Planctomycetota bacterium]
MSSDLLTPRDREGEAPAEPRISDDFPRVRRVHYEAATPGVAVAVQVTVRLDQDNEVQPDASLRLDTQPDAQRRISDDDYVEGPPD